MRSTFNILFYVNKSKEKNGVVHSTEKCVLGYTLLRHQSVGLAEYHITCHFICKGYKCKGKARKTSLTLSNLHNILSSKTLEI